jgi:hypothetical protein
MSPTASCLSRVAQQLPQRGDIHRNPPRLRAGFSKDEPAGSSLDDADGSEQQVGLAKLILTDGRSQDASGPSTRPAGPPVTFERCCSGV